MTTTEDLRRAWVDAVAEANQLADDLEDRRHLILTKEGEQEIARLTKVLAKAQAQVEKAHKAYSSTTSNWATEAPKRMGAVFVPNIAQTESGLVMPCISIGFRGMTEDEPITVALIMTEMDLRRMQTDLDKAITASVRQAQKVRLG